MTELRSKAGR